MTPIQLAQLQPGPEGTTIQTLNGVPTWVTTDVGFLVVQTFTSNAPGLVTIIDTATIPNFASGLPLNSAFRVGLWTGVRDTADDFRFDQNSQLWVRLTAGAPTQIASGANDQGPQALFSAALADVVGASIAASATGLLMQYNGSASSIHLSGTMKLYLQVIPMPRAT